MSLLVANVDFAFGASSFQHQKIYDTALPWVAAANAAVPQLFGVAGGGKTANTAFVMKDSRGGGFERVIHRGDIVDASDSAVTAAPTNFS